MFFLIFGYHTMRQDIIVHFDLSIEIPSMLGYTHCVPYIPRLIIDRSMRIISSQCAIYKDQIFY